MTSSFYIKFIYIPTEFWNIYVLLFKYTGKKILSMNKLSMGENHLREVRNFLIPRAL